MPDIKTRDVVKGTVKAIDKSAVAAERMKDAYFAPLMDSLIFDKKRVRC